ncbi:hypothetical protein [Rhizobium ruizarguesonis]|uniref:Uncharacterized protein n=1 Tax=Rhizobium ruizarguesonis TaxID=2081791 RepID=A0AB38HQJ8_9HYPH|nr:hypothetical protein [Rhizobium ruizarguesonis]TAZ67168.1 hypothetical protein ELH68_35600 [Rhizobium ruizarguesonis]TAZ92105.1 hypothetical protein ELH64_31345 [Rhizobium ruizarguesonis]TBC01053.1 hypothetical protein ELH40_39185 [Rhizobium ruizarguesonis]
MSFYSNSSSQRLDDTLEAMRLVMPDVLEREREVANKKWFAYRFMTPLAATKHFASLYSKGFKAYIRFNRDRDEAELRQGLGSRIFQKPNGSLTELWRARQRADELGLPYELLIEFGFEFARKGGWKNAPRPMQLFGSADSDIAWPLEIEKFLNERLPHVIDRLADLPQYRVENYRHLPVQDDFRCYVIDHVRASTKPWAFRLTGPCLEKRHLPLLLALKLAPQDQRWRIMTELRLEQESELTIQAPREALPQIALVPACFGLIAAYAAAVSPCSSCPFSARCQAMGKAVAAAMIKRHGSVSTLKDERDQTRKAGQRRRTARWRAKKELEASMSLREAV